MNDFAVNDTGNVAYLPTAHATVTLRGFPSVKGTPSGPADLVLPTSPSVRPMLTAGNELIAFWGENNDYPQRIIELANKSTIIPQALADKAALWVAGGVMATKDRKSEDELDDDDIYKFLNNTTFKRYLLEAALDMGWFWNGFPELILSRDRSCINELHNNETAYCRWGRMDNRGQLSRIFMNANWPEASATDPDTQVFSCVNPYRSDRFDLVRGGSDFKYIYPLNLPSPGKSYMQLAPWDAARSSGWLDYLAAIPQFKKFGMINKMALRYHIEVPKEYWPEVYLDRWEKADLSGKMAIRDEFLKALTDSLTGAVNANKSVLTDKWIDTQGKEHNVVIHVLDDKEKDNKYNEDYSDGQANLLYALGTDPSLFGFQSKDIQRSGGSDKRQAFDIFIAKSTPFRARLLEPLEFIAQYNGWLDKYPRLTFKFRDTLLTTLDTGASTAETKTAP